jgi:hypothetical protein
MPLLPLLLSAASALCRVLAILVHNKVTQARPVIFSLIITPH